MKNAKSLPKGLGENILSGPWRPVDRQKTIGDRIPYGSSIYFVGGLGYIKIGYSADFRQRYEQLSMWFPIRLEIIAVIGIDREIGLKTEASIHKELDEHRSNGEWFIDCAAVRAKAYDGLQSGFVRPDPTKGCSGRIIKDEVIWASNALKRIACPIDLNEPISKRLRRAADAAGVSHTRAFDIWYRKARQISEPERRQIASVLGGAHVE